MEHEVAPEEGGPGYSLATCCRPLDIIPVYVSLQPPIFICLYV